MKVYRSKSDGPKKKLNKKVLISIGVSLALVAAALAITLTLTLGGNKPPIEPDPPTPAGATPVYVLPMDGYEVGKTFSNEKLVKYYTSGWFETHEGLDFLAPAGTEVKSIFDGTVLSVDVGTSMEGTVIKIQHAEGVVSVYKGLGNEPVVSVGDEVKSGDVIGVIGKMPIEAREYEQSHLHLEVFKNNVKVNPLDFIPEIGDK